MSNRFLCIHGHFYQPPRENPFTGVIPLEHGAEPYHDFNEKITAECYRPNAELGNFDRVSFDVGPTLARWLEQNDPATYRRILGADRAGGPARNGFAQGYNHTILPLMNRRDKVTQVRWGLADFRARFGREPESLWLPETGADLESLEVLAEHGLRYVILAPWQARAADLDTTQTYLIDLGGGRRIAGCFFDGALSKRVAADAKFTRDPTIFAELCLPLRLSYAAEKRGRRQWLLVASDGEFYGHHHRGREQFLADLLGITAPANGFALTTPSAYLDLEPPRETVALAERTAWSCYHGLDRWTVGCPCTPGDSSWKQPLRAALDWLATAIDAVGEEAASGVDFWRARDDYARVLTAAAPVEQVVADHASGALATAAHSRVTRLLEAQYYRQLMFTSCGFFFEDLDRIEPKNNIAYAARAVALVREATGDDLEPELARRLALTRSGRNGLTGAQILRDLHTSAAS